MKLIYADELKKELCQQWFMDILLTQRNSEDMFYALAQKIDAQPTAYDVDKVVEQLEEWTFNADVNIGDGTMMNHNLIVSKNAIEIVKGGGVE